jgi:hypothetical protein
MTPTLNTFKTITRILFEHYGCGVLVGDTTVILWAADRAADEVGVEGAKKELKKLNRFRLKMGKVDAFFSHGHRMF